MLPHFLRLSLPLILVLAAGAAGADKLVLVAGTGTENPGGLATKVKLDGPFGVDFDSHGRMYLVEISGHRVLALEPNGHLTHLGGTGEKGNGGDDGPVAKAQFNGMHSLAVGKDDAVYVADTWNNRVRRIDPRSAVITAFAGTGTKGDATENGPAVKADLGGIYCIAFDAPRENLYLVDLDNRKLRKVNVASGEISTVAGNGMKGVPENGALAVESPLVDPRAVALSPDGTIYLLERGGHTLRVIDKQGKIKTVAGTGKAGATGDGGDALQATLNGPKHLCVDLDGTVLIADTENHAIRRYDPKSGKITRIAGTGKKGTAGLDGDPLNAELFQPHGVWIGPDKRIYVTDSGNHRVLRIEPATASAAGADRPTQSISLKAVGPTTEAGIAAGVLVPDVALVQTAQFFPTREGAVVAGDVVSQWALVWLQIQQVLQTWDGELVRVHVYAATQEALDEVQKQMNFGSSKVALTSVVGKLPDPKALVAADVIFATGSTDAAVTLQPQETDLKCARAAKMPPGARLYVSGQAAKGDLPTATRLTLESLEKTLQAQGLDKKHVVQVKAFVTPISDAPIVRKEIAAFFGEKQVPPVTLVEWSSTLPIEIELVAWAGPARAGEPVQYFDAPGLPNSPVYSRVARINHGPVLFTSGLYSPDEGSGEAEVTGIFNILNDVLKESGSDLKHLVKATYYVSREEPSAKLNELRPKYYDPKRPPAASKAQVQGTGNAKRGLTMDLIAVPVE